MNVIKMIGSPTIQCSLLFSTVLWAMDVSAFCDSNLWEGSRVPISRNGVDFRISGMGPQTACVDIPVGRDLVSTHCGVMNPHTGMQGCGYQKECNIVQPNGPTVRAGFTEITAKETANGLRVCATLITRASKLLWRVIVKTKSSNDKNN